MAELKPAQPKTLTQRLMEVLFGDQSISDYNIRRIKEAEDFARQQEEFKAAGGGLGAPIPGANPEVPTPGDAIVGALMGLGGAGIPPEIARSGQITRPNTAEGRVYHGTFTRRPLRKRPGIHVGTLSQATDRITDPLTGKPGNRSHIFPMEFTPEKTAKIQDLGSGNMFPGNLVQALKKAGYLSRNEIADQPRMSSIYRALRKKGYDAIEYKNRFEGPGTSYQVLDIRKLEPAFGKTEDMNIGIPKKIPKGRRKELARARTIRDLESELSILYEKIMKAYDSGLRPDKNIQTRYDEIRKKISDIRSSGK